MLPNLNPIHPRMFYFKFDWNLLRISWKDEWLQTTEKCWFNRKLICTNCSLKKKVKFNFVYVNFHGFCKICEPLIAPMEVPQPPNIKTHHIWVIVVGFHLSITWWVTGAIMGAHWSKRFSIFLYSRRIQFLQKKKKTHQYCIWHHD